MQKEGSPQWLTEFSYPWFASLGFLLKLGNGNQIIYCDCRGPGKDARCLSGADICSSGRGSDPHCSAQCLRDLKGRGGGIVRLYFRNGDCLVSWVDKGTKCALMSSSWGAVILHLPGITQRLHSDFGICEFLCSETICLSLPCSPS